VNRKFQSIEEAMQQLIRDAEHWSDQDKRECAQILRDHTAKLVMKQKRGITDLDPHGILATRATAKRAIRVIH
jgi:uncharacterized membrane-anchored protein